MLIYRYIHMNAYTYKHTYVRTSIYTHVDIQLGGRSNRTRMRIVRFGNDVEQST